MIEKETGPGGGVTVVNVDPGGSFFEKFWEQPVEGESVDWREGGRKPAKGTLLPDRTALSWPVRRPTWSPAACATSG